MKYKKYLRTLSLMIGLLLLASIFNQVKAQKDSENNHELRRYLMYFPRTDLNGNSILTEDEYRRHKKLIDYIDSRQKYLSKMPERTFSDHSYGPHWRNSFDFWKADTDQNLIFT